MWYVLIYCETIDGQNIQTLRKRLDWHLRPQVSKLNNVCVTCPAVGFDFFLSTRLNPWKKTTTLKFVHVKTVAYCHRTLLWMRYGDVTRITRSKIQKPERQEVPSAAGSRQGCRSKSWQVFKPPLDAAAFTVGIFWVSDQAAFRSALHSLPSHQIAAEFGARLSCRKREREQKTQSQQPLHPRPGYAFSYRFLQSVGLPTQHSSAKESFHHRFPSCFARHLHLL